jgi:hypothetical protein
MNEVLGVLAGILLLVGAGFILYGFGAFVVGIARRSGEFYSPQGNHYRSSTTPGDELDGMNDGDYYNGPGGYHATGGYENSFYGSMHDGDHDHGHH